MTTITTRSGKGAPLTNAEVDANFTNLNNDKLENITGEPLKNLADVSSSMNPTNGQVLTYNSVSAAWYAADAASPYGDADVQSLLNSSTAITSQFLLWDGSTYAWGTPPNTTYSAGTGLNLVGTTFNNTAPDRVVSLTGGGATTVSGTYPNFTISSTDTNTNTTYAAGNGVTLTGTTFSVSAGGGLTQNAGGLSHTDTSTQVSVNNAGAVFIQDVTLDGFGHVTGLGSTTVTPALIGAAATSHSHSIANVSGLQTALDGKASTTYVDTAVASVVDTAPAALDTLNELAAALGDDPNFATTVSTQIGTKLNATANAVSASKWLTARTINLGGDLSGSVSLDGSSNVTLSAQVADDSHNHTIGNVDGLQVALDGKLPTTGKAADSNLLDGLDSTAFYLASNPSGYTANVGDITGVTAGDGITGGGTSGTVTISHADTSTQSSLTALTGANVVSDIDLDGFGHVTALATRVMTAADLGALTANQTITLSGDLTGSGTTSINAQIAANVVGANELNVTGNGTTSQYLRSDGDGTFTWATPPDTNTTYTAGSGLGLAGTVFSHADTSSQVSVNNSGATVIQDVTVDTYGHVTGLGSATLTPATIGAATSAQGSLADSAVQPNDNPSFGSVTVSGTVDGRDVAADGTKLDGIEIGADVTDANNVNPLVDAHLNVSAAAVGYVLSWTGSDYGWVEAGGSTSTTRNIDGGAASTVYLASQTLNGGNA